jgi:hypothetical protein
MSVKILYNLKNLLGFTGRDREKKSKRGEGNEGKGREMKERGVK